MARVGDLVSLITQLDLEKNLPLATRERRDRGLAPDLSSFSKRPVRQIQAWLGRVQGEEAARKADKATAAYGWLMTLVLLLGALMGASTAAAVLAYDGTQPVNVVHFLAAFVGLQLLLLALIFILLLPTTVTRFIPGMRAMQSLLVKISPGRLARVLARLLPRVSRESLMKVMASSQRHQASLGSVQKWMVLHFAQGLAVAFNTAALLTCLSLVIFSDLAFSWSTTLNAEPKDFHKVTSVLARPWSSWWPDADPDLELIASSRYFRFKDGELGVSELADAEQLGGWWPFLMACLVTYGLMPRLLLWMFCRVQLVSALRYTMRYYPGVSDVLDRINHPQVETRGEASVDLHGPESRNDRYNGHALEPLRDPGSYLIVWAGLPFPVGDLLTQIGVDDAQEAQVIHAGGAQDLEQDQEILRTLEKHKPDKVTVVVKGWEPATLDLLDFLEALRNALPHGAMVRVLVVGLEGDSPAACDSAAMHQWSSRLQQLADPWLTVHSLCSREAAP